eukprot:m.1079447 g.1079447  ORF g.1079447 m.1079447 type:complete len:66 (-) comp24254_c0_seq65:2455-2652(-)
MILRCTMLVQLWEVKDQCVTFFNDSIDAFKSAARGQRAGGEDLRSLPAGSIRSAPVARVAQGSFL